MSFTCFLFDLDGTLVLTGGAGMRAFEKGFRTVFNVEGSLATISAAGKTDPAILRELCQKTIFREPEPDEVNAVFTEYLRHLQWEVDNSTHFRVLPGIESLLPLLQEKKSCRIGLGTGNVEGGARIKLERADLWKYFSFGGYGSDALERPRLLAKAVARGEASLGPGERFSRVYVIGDTPLDIAAGKAVGAVTVGIATGPYPPDELKKAGADLCYSDLGRVSDFLTDVEF